jgi:hypothetical protein
MCSDYITYKLGPYGGSVAVAVAIANDLTANPAVEAVNLAAAELTAALVLLLLNKFLLPPSL